MFPLGARTYTYPLARSWTPYSSTCLFRFSVLNVSEESDSRLKPLWTSAPRTWSHEEIWDLITNSGMNAHPDDIKSLKVQDPVVKADYFVEGCRYVAALAHHCHAFRHGLPNCT